MQRHKVNNNTKDDDDDGNEIRTESFYVWKKASLCITFYAMKLKAFELL